MELKTEICSVKVKKNRPRITLLRLKEQFKTNA